MTTSFGAAAAILACALIADRLIGDPVWLWRRVPHPVALAGRLIESADRRLNRAEFSRRHRRVHGALTVIGSAAGAALVGFGLERLLALVWWGAAANAAMVAVLLAHRSLLEHVGAVASRLAAGDLERSRAAVGRIVGRDVTAFDAPATARAAIESLAESFSDGVVAPALWYLVAGLPGLLAYKVVNTADSMIGHRTDRHADFGVTAARLDDLLNLVPARFSALLIAAAAFARGRSAAGAAFAAAWRDAARHRSPNAGWPEAAMAGALGLSLGGPRSYGAVAVDGAVLNAGGRREATAADVRTATRLTDLAWLILLCAVAGLALLALRPA